MVDYLSPQWLAAADDALRSDEALQAVGDTVELVIEQTVTRAGEQPIRYHIRFGGPDASVQLVSGPAPHPDVAYVQSYPAAVNIATGRDSAQMAFMRGDLTVSGDVRALITHRRLLDRLTETLTDLRRQTRFGPTTD